MPLVRKATPEDAIAINRVSAHLGYSAVPDSVVEETLRSMTASQTDRVYVAEDAGRVVGWIHSFSAQRLASPPFEEIGGLVVDPAFRGRGVGRSLVDHVQANCAGTVRVRCNETRTETHRFYASLGFDARKTQRIFERD